MIIEIDKQAGHVHAQGHSVPLEQGGEAELKRRCYEGLAKLNAPPDEVLFVRLWELEQHHESDNVPTAPGTPSAIRAASPAASPAAAPPVPVQAPAPPPRSHKKKS